MAFLDFFAGMCGGAGGVICGHPFDTVKVRLQTQSLNNPMYRGTLDCFRKIIEQETASGLYKGVSSPLAGLAFINAIVFGVYGNTLRVCKNPDSVSSHVCAGALAGFAQSFICSPMELAKLRMQLQSEGSNCPKQRLFATPGSFKAPVSYSGPMDCLVKTYMDHGVTGLFKGLTLNIYRDVTGFAIYFASYEYMTRYMAQRRGSKDLSAPQLLFAGGFAGMLSWLLNYPVDVIKSRYQADGAAGLAPKYRSIKDCILKSHASEGPRVFWQGLGSTLIRAFPTNAVTFFTVAMVYRLFAKVKQYHANVDGADYIHAYAHVMEAGTTLLDPLCFADSPSSLDPLRRLLFSVYVS